MLFVIRKFLLYLSKPLSLLVIFMIAVGLKRRDRIIVFLGITLYLLGITPVANLFLRPLEERSKPPSYVDRSITTVVVLSGDMYTRGDELEDTGCSSLKRFLGGIILCKRIGNCTLILSGGSLFGEEPASKVMSRLVASFGNYTVVVEAASRTTLENALGVREIVGTEPFYLVTSAYHMPRSLMLFAKLGMHPVPYPVDYLVEKRYNLEDFFPQGRNVRKVELALHEYLALLFYSLFSP